MEITMPYTTSPFAQAPILVFGRGMQSVHRHPDQPPTSAVLELTASIVSRMMMKNTGTEKTFFVIVPEGGGGQVRATRRRGDGLSSDLIARFSHVTHLVTHAFAEQMANAALQDL